MVAWRRFGSFRLRRCNQALAGSISASPEEMRQLSEPTRCGTEMLSEHSSEKGQTALSMPAGKKNYFSGSMSMDGTTNMPMSTFSFAAVSAPSAVGRVSGRTGMGSTGPPSASGVASLGSSRMPSATRGVGSSDMMRAFEQIKAEQFVREVQRERGVMGWVLHGVL